MEAQSAFYLNYSQGRLDNNAQELKRLEEFIHTALQRSDLIDHIYLTGYSSIEGSYALNDQLSRERVEQTYLYLKNAYPEILNHDHSIASVAEDWQGLVALVRQSSLPEREEILNIICKVPSYDEREQLLSQLNGGESYRYMEKHFFPSSRKVELRMEYRITPKEMPKVSEPLVTEDPTSITQQQPKYDIGLPTLQRTETLQRAETEPYYKLAAKLDLIPGLVGIPSAGLEYFPTRWLSIGLYGTYAQWVFSNESREIYNWSLTPELRYYWQRKATLTSPRFFAGGYYTHGEFDFRFGGAAGRMGSYWGTGLSTGVSGLLFPTRTNRWLWETSIGVGHNQVEYDRYRFDGIRKLYNGSRSRVIWGPSFFRLSIIYRFSGSKGDAR